MSYNQNQDGGERRPRRDPMEQIKKVFIGGLDYDTTSEGLKEHFAKYGTITDVVVIMDKTTGKSRGFGFVTFEKLEDVDYAQSERPHEIDGKTVDTKRALSRDSHGSESKTPNPKIFVGGIPKDTTVEQLTEAFAEYGELKDVAVVKDKATGDPRGFGFVTYEDFDCADRCLAKHFNPQG